MATIHIEIISAEGPIFSGDANYVSVPAETGSLGILPGHTPLIAKVKPGTVVIEKDNAQEYVFVAGGVIEVQPQHITVLADTAIRAHDLDEAKVAQAKQDAEDAIQNRQGDFDLAKAQAELAISTAQLLAIANLRKKRY